MAMLARDTGFAEIIIPAPNAPEAAITGAVPVRPVGYLSEVVEYLKRGLEVAAAGSHNILTL